MERSRAKRLQMIVVIFLSLAMMAALDYYTGQELVFSCAYLVPVGLTAWWFSRRFLYVICLLSGVTSLLVDHFDGYDYSAPWIEFWNAGSCLLISISVGYVLSRLRQTLTERTLANDELRRALDQLEASTAEIRKLQNGLQTVCAWTNKIKVGDQWMSAEEFLTEQLHLSLTHGMSPDAFREMGKRLGVA